jgi:hypothetical protein
VSSLPEVRPLLSAIFIIDELPSLERLPWRESVHSTLRFVDELIVVHGGKRNADGRQPAWEYLQGLDDPRIQIHHFPWPEDFDWRQIGRSCAYGHLHARGQWCLRVLADEVFADDFKRVRDVLSNAEESLRLVLCDRLYMLGREYAQPYHIQLIFRNDKTLGFGAVNPAQGGSAMPALFDGPIETDLWFDGKEVVSIREDSILRDARGAERLLAGETPHGYRPPELRNATYVQLGLFNVDVNYFTDEEIICQKEISQGGYERLPAVYGRPRDFPKGRSILGAVSDKIRQMIETGCLRRVRVPESLARFQDRQAGHSNVVRRVCEAHGFRWDGTQPPLSPLQRFSRISAQMWPRWRNRIQALTAALRGRRNRAGS